MFRIWDFIGIWILTFSLSGFCFETVPSSMQCRRLSFISGIKEYILLHSLGLYVKKVSLAMREISSNVFVSTGDGYNGYLERFFRGETGLTVLT